MKWLVVKLLIKLETIFLVTFFYLHLHNFVIVFYYDAQIPLNVPFIISFFLPSKNYSATENTEFTEISKNSVNPWNPCLKNLCPFVRRKARPRQGRVSIRG